MDIQARVDDLETRLAFQDDTIQTLNDVIASQQQVIARIGRQMELLLRRQEEILSRVGGVDEEEAPPPHY